MVFFTCNTCGDSLKKNKVEKHAWQCRTNSLACIDCLKDFSLQSYASHNECITENQKYGGLNYKQQEFKGKNKQADWVQKIKALISENKYPKEIQNILQSLVSYDNIPRKKAKFLNFVRNSFRIRDEKLINKVWDVFEISIKQNATNKNDQMNGSTNGNCEIANGSSTKRTKDAEETNDKTVDNVETKKKKAKINAEDNVEPEVVIEDQATQNTNEKIKMKKIIKEILLKHEQMLIVKLRKKILKRYHKNGFTNDNEIVQKFEKIISKNKFAINENLISLSQ